MLRMCLVALVISVIVWAGAAAVGNAFDHEYEDHIITTIDGQTLDCQRITDVAGNVFYDSCEEVHAP